MNDVVLGNDENTAPLLDPTKCVDLIQKGAYGTFNINQNTEIKKWNENTSNPPESLVSRAQRCLQIGIRFIIIVQLPFHFVDRAYRVAEDLGWKGLAEILYFFRNICEDSDVFIFRVRQFHPSWNSIWEQPFDHHLVPEMIYQSDNRSMIV